MSTDQSTCNGVCEKAVGVAITGITTPPALTVEEQFDKLIQEARQQVEKLCVKKAKLEAMNLHKYPYSDLVNLLHSWDI